MNPLTTLLTHVTLDQPQTHANLRIYPLRIPNGQPRRYRTLDEALQAQELVVKEISQAGSVPNLTVQNTGKLPVLIVVGEELIGAKQNRVLNTSLLVPAASELEIPVSCVERGRWHYTSAHFSSSASVSHSSLRMMQTQRVTDNLREKAAYDADQGAVWQEVERKISSHGSSSPTRALHDVYEQTENQLQDYLKAFQPPQAEGILVAINDQVVGIDLFDHAETLRTLWPKLARSYALDALERQQVDQPAAAETPQQFLTSVQKAKDEVYDSVGLGQDVRLSGEQIAGSGLLWDEHLVHASLFKTRR